MDLGLLPRAKKIAGGGVYCPSSAIYATHMQEFLGDEKR